jgi:hypothetical protein
MSDRNVRPFGLASLEVEEYCKKTFPYMEITPSEYINTRDAFLQLMTSDYHLYNYRDKYLDEWIGIIRNIYPGFYVYFDMDDIKEDFPYTTMSPEEYAARHSHDIHCFGLHLYYYKDEVFEKWLLRLGKILYSNDLIDHCRKTLLTPEEIEIIEEESRTMEF